MLLIPIAQEHSTVRREPWVSYTVIVLCTLIYMGFDLLGSQREARAQLHGTEHEIFELLVRRPYLTLPPLVSAILPEETRDQLSRAGERMRKDGQLPDEAVIEQAQTQLDELATRCDEQLRGLPEQRFGYVPARARPYALVTSVFMHAGWLHLLGNMLFFFLSGPFVEDVWGRPLFAAFYLAAGVVATLTYGATQPDSLAALVGASGAIAGVMGAFLVRFGGRRIEFLFLPIPILPTIRTRFFMPAYVVLPFWFGQQVLFAGADSDGSGVAWWAHIGGFLFGVAVAVVVRVTRFEERVVNPAIERQTLLLAHPSLEKAIDARVAGHLVLAERELARVLSADAGNVDACSEVYELALARADLAEVGRAAERLLDLLRKGNEQGLAMALIDDPRWRDLGSLTPRFYLAAAAVLEREGDFRRAIELYGDAARVAPQELAGVRALARRGELLLRAGNAREARLAFEAAQAHPAYGPPWSEVVQRGLETLRVPGR
jgi:membrane associated rhomboid family serine protease